MCLVSPQNEPVKKDGLSVQILFFAKELSIINLCINNLSIVPNNLFTHSKTLGYSFRNLDKFTRLPRKLKNFFTTINEQI